MLALAKGKHKLKQKKVSKHSLKKILLSSNTGMTLSESGLHCGYCGHI